MGKIQSYSSVVITDYSDVGTLNLYLTCNQPTSVIYDPNSKTYTPDWSTSNLKITPVVAFNGKNLSLSAAGMNVSFLRREGSGDRASLTTGESLSDGILTVSVNKLASVSSKLLTYICQVTYTDPKANIPVTSEATLSFTLVSNAQKAVDGQNVGFLEIYSDNGGVIQNGQGSTTLRARLRYGNSVVSSGVTYTWTKYGTSNGSTGYVISAGTGSSITVSGDDVEGTAWYKCTTSSFNGVVYDAYYTVTDVQDPVQSYTYATVPQFRNSQGCGAVYTRVYRNGDEIDQIPTLIFSETAPSSPAKGDLYYKLNRSDKTCTLMEYNGSAWVASSHLDTCTYAYYRIDKNGKELDTTNAFKSVRAIYVDPSMISGTMQFRCEVTVP